MGLKRIVLVALVAMLAVGFCGCKKKETPKTGDGMGAAAEKMKEQTAEAGKTAQQAMIEAKNEFAEASQKQVDKLKQEFDALKAKADSEGADAQKEYAGMKTDFDKKMDAASKQMEQLKSASADTWQDTKEGVSKAIDDLKAAYDKAASRFGGKQQ
jgi:gas vesicle protein